MNYTVLAMARAANPHPTANYSHIINDPAHLNMMIQLLLLSGLAAVGTIGNVFAVSAVMLDDHLKRKGRFNRLIRHMVWVYALRTLKRHFFFSPLFFPCHPAKLGNVFIVNLAIADFIVSAFAIPASSVTILAGKPDNMSVCTFQWIAAILCCHISVLTLMFIALENQGRILSSGEEYQKLFGKSEVIVAISTTWAISSICVVCQFSLNLGPDYCRMIFKVCIIVVF